MHRWASISGAGGTHGPDRRPLALLESGRGKVRIGIGAQCDFARIERLTAGSHPRHCDAIRGHGQGSRQPPVTVGKPAADQPPSAPPESFDAQARTDSCAEWCLGIGHLGPGGCAFRHHCDVIRARKQGSRRQSPVQICPMEESKRLVMPSATRSEQPMRLEERVSLAFCQTCICCLVPRTRTGHEKNEERSGTHLLSRPASNR